MHMDIEDTHKIAYRTNNRLLADSSNRDWRYAYASLARETPWSGEVPAVPHLGLAFSLKSPTRVHRAIPQDGRTESAWLKPRQFSILPAGTAMHWTVEGNPDILLIYIHSAILEEARGAYAEPVIIHPRLAHYDPIMDMLCGEFFEELSLASSARSARAIDLATRQIAMQIVKRHSSAATAPQIAISDGRRRVLEARAFIEDNIFEPIDIASISRAAGTSPSRLNRAFKQEYGTTPHNYLLQQRIEASKALLSRGMSSIAEIAFECGFSSQSHFTSTFRKIAGTTPKAFRASLLN